MRKWLLGKNKNLHKKLWMILFLVLLSMLILYSNFSIFDATYSEGNEDELLLGQYNDTSQCGKLSSEEQDFCYYWVAFVRMNASICQNVRNLSKKDFCFKQVALRNYSPETCMNITSEKEKDFCLYILELRENETLYPKY